MKNREDLTGQVFGYRTVLGHYKDSHGYDSYFVKTKCVCGTEGKHTIYDLKNGKRIGKCSKCPRDDLLDGKKFGKLTVIRATEAKHPSNKYKYWICRCECGKELSIKKSDLVTGQRTRCRECTYEDLTGQVFGSQTVLRRDIKKKKWLVKCGCGQEYSKTAQVIKKTHGCNRCETYKKIGERFGRLTFLGPVRFEHSENKYATIGEFLCDCGNIKEINVGTVFSGGVTSCDCLRNETRLENAKKMLGITYGNNTPIKILGYKPDSKVILMLCKCVCGRKLVKELKRVKDGSGCGCKIDENRKKGENHPRSKITNSFAAAVKELIKSDVHYSREELAKMFNVSIQVIHHILSGRTYVED
jgi:hypothetical protein